MTINNKDQGTIETIKEILRRLHDPKTGFRGYKNDLRSRQRAENLTDNQVRKLGMDKIAKLAAENGIGSDASFDEQKFSLHGKQIVENRIYASCGNAAKAFCYINSLLPAEQQLDIMIMLSTDPAHFIDGMAGHTLPCVKMSDGKYYALDPQIKLTEQEPDIQFLKEDIVVGGYVNHVLPEIAKHGRPYKITKIVTPEYHEKELSSFHRFISESVVRDETVSKTCETIEAMLRSANISKQDAPNKQVYDFCKQLTSRNIEKQIRAYRNSAYVQFNNQWYRINFNKGYLILKLMDENNPMPPIEKLQTPSDFIKWFEGGEMFLNGIKSIRAIAENKKLTEDNYSKQRALSLGNDIIAILRPHILKNKAVLTNWNKTTYIQRQQYVREIITTLLEKFPSKTVKPKIYFREDINKANKNHAAIPLMYACFFEKEFVPSYASLANQVFGNDEPFFAFFHDLSDNGMIGQIVHEFTHYLQATGQSTIKQEIVKIAGKYYKLPDENHQIYQDSIFEVEAREIGEYTKQQLNNITHSLDLALIKQSKNQKN